MNDSRSKKHLPASAKIQQWSIVRITIILLTLLLIGIGAIPGYWRGSVPGSDLPQTNNLNSLRQIRADGLTLPNWQTIEQREVTIGGHKWSRQQLEQEQSGNGTAKKLTLLLLPQTYYLNQPEVEWMDVNGRERWKTDSQNRLNFSVKHSSRSLGVTARFFRAWNRRQTYAVVQWYAWPEGGHFSPSRWFLADRLAQLHRQRVPWVAVCLQIPIEPLGELEAAKSDAESLAKMVQNRLLADPFRPFLTATNR